MNFPVTLSIAAPAGGVTLTYSTANVTATAGSDYVVVVAGSVNATLGNSSATGTIINDDAVVPPQAVVPVPVNSPIALFALMLGVLSFAWRRAAG